MNQTSIYYRIGPYVLRIGCVAPLGYKSIQIK